MFQDVDLYTFIKKEYPLFLPLDLLYYIVTIIIFFENQTIAITHPYIYLAIEQCYNKIQNVENLSLKMTLFMEC